MAWDDVQMESIAVDPHMYEQMIYEEDCTGESGQSTIYIFKWW